MFKHTLAALDKSVDDLKRACFKIDILVNILYIIYLVYALVVGTGNVIINAVLCSLSVVFFVTYIATSLDEGKKRARKLVKITYKRIKLFIDAFSLAIAIYSIYIAAERATVISILLTVASLFGWIVKVSMDVAVRFIEARVALITAAWKMDTEVTNKARNAVRWVVGDELIEDEVPPELREQLEALAEEYANEKKDKKQKKKFTRREVRRKRYESWRGGIRERRQAKKEERAKAREEKAKLKAEKNPPADEK